MASYVKSQTPEEVVSNVIEALSVAKDTGKLRKGINETTKSVEKKAAKLVVMAEDVEPEEIIIHMPALCEEKGIPYTYVPSKKDLGAAAGMGVGTSSIAIEDAGNAAELLQGILKRLPKAGASPAAEEKEGGAPGEEKKEKPREAKEPRKERKKGKPRGQKKKEAPKEVKEEEKEAPKEGAAPEGEKGGGKEEGKESPKEEKKEEAPGEVKKEGKLEAPKEEEKGEKKEEPSKEGKTGGAPEERKE